MSEKQDVYGRVTNKIIADLERGNLTWLQPWQAGHQAGPVSRPLRAAGRLRGCFENHTGLLASRFTMSRIIASFSRVSLVCTLRS